jgi:topoisomerase-4 subunit A
MYFSANHNGEAEVIKVTLKPNPKLKKPVFDKDFSELMIKGRQSMGNLLTRNEVKSIGLKSLGSSTLGGRKVWFDKDILRLDFDGHGDFLGEFDSDDLLLVINADGEYYTTAPDANCHFDPGLLRIEKYNPGKVWTALLFDASQKGYLYLKRFNLDPSAKRINILGEEKENRLVLLTDTVYPRLLVTLGGADSFREPMEIDADSFVGVKGVKARGRRVTAFNVKDVEELVPLRMPEPEPEPQPVDTDSDDNDNSAQTDDENTEKVDDGQLSLF